MLFELYMLIAFLVYALIGVVAFGIDAVIHGY